MALIALGITGGIGAYKSVEVCRGLQKRGHEVVAVMTRAATRFVGPITFEAITRRPVITSQWRPGANAGLAGSPPRTPARWGASSDVVCLAPLRGADISQRRQKFASFEAILALGDV